MASPLLPAAHPPPPAALLYLLLDVDGVLNAVEADEGDEEDVKAARKHARRERKQRKELQRAQPKSPPESRPARDRPITASGPSCVPSLDSVQSALARCDLSQSLDPALVHNMLRLVHCFCGCGDEEACAASLPSPPSSRSRVQVVLTSTWRLQAESLRTLGALFEALGLCSSPTATDPSTTTERDSCAPPSSKHSCAHSTLPLLAAPDLRGWGTRVDEILLFLRSASSGSSEKGASISSASLAAATGSLPPAPAPAVRFLIVDDMDLYARSAFAPPLSPAESLLHAQCLRRTLRVDGRRGLDSSQVDRALGVGFTVAREAVSEEFLEALGLFEPPRPPSDADE